MKRLQMAKLFSHPPLMFVLPSPEMRGPMVSYPLPICQQFHDIIYPSFFSSLCVFAALKTIITFTVDVFAFPHMAVVQRLQRTWMWMKRVCSNTPPL